MSLNLNPDIEARLIGLAQASGVSVEEFLQQIVEEKTAVAFSSPAERATAWRESVKGLPHTKLLSDDAVSRESIYSDRPAYELQPEEWIRQFKAWTASHSGNTVVLPDEAMERESIYGDRGL